MEKLVFKKCTIDDVPALAEIGALTFKETFAAENTEEDMAKYLQEDFNEEKIYAEVADKDSIFIIAQTESDGGLKTAAYMKVNFPSAQTEKGYENSLEIQRIYVAKACKGRGIGSHFMEKALEIARENKVEYVWLGVWEKNYKAIKFYQDKGFVPFGEHTFLLGNDPQTDYLMKKIL